MGEIGGRNKERGGVGVVGRMRSMGRGGRRMNKDLASNNYKLLALTSPHIQIHIQITNR